MKANPHLLLTIQIRALGLPKPEHEFRFHKKRRWRFDLAWPRAWSVDGPRPECVGLGVEVHGGVYRYGRHTRGAGFTADREKMNAAVELGWRVLEFTTEQVESGQAVQQIKRMLKKGVGDGSGNDDKIQQGRDTSGVATRRNRPIPA